MTIEIRVSEQGKSGEMEIGVVKLSSLNELCNNYLDKFTEKKYALHEKAETVNEIAKVVELTRTYNYVYWLAKLKQFEKCGGSYWLVRDWLKEISSYPGNFNKGAILTNKFKKFSDEFKATRQKNKGTTS